MCERNVLLNGTLPGYHGSFFFKLRYKEFNRGVAERIILQPDFLQPGESSQRRDVTYQIIGKSKPGEIGQRRQR